MKANEGDSSLLQRTSMSLATTWKSAPGDSNNFYAENIGRMLVYSRQRRKEVLAWTERGWLLIQGTVAKIHRRDQTSNEHGWSRDALHRLNAIVHPMFSQYERVLFGLLAARANHVRAF